MHVKLKANKGSAEGLLIFLLTDSILTIFNQQRRTTMTKKKPLNKDEQAENGISRRDILLGMGAAASFAYAGSAAAAMSGMTTANIPPSRLMY